MSSTCSMQPSQGVRVRSPGPASQRITAGDLVALVRNVLEEKFSDLRNLSKFLWENPETAAHETRAHDRLCEFLEGQGFKVRRHHCLDTAFRAEYSPPGGADGPTVALLAEYDALPVIGHACGRNLVAQSSLGAAVAVKEAMAKFTDIRGKVVVLGTPAKEENAGKIWMLEQGAFHDIDVAMAAYPGTKDVLKCGFAASQKLTVTYTGKASHAGDSPWEGVNAADAAVSAYVSLAMLRQRIKPTSRVLAFIEECGHYPNVIAEASQMTCQVFTDDQFELDALQARVERCLYAAAHATACSASIRRGRRCKTFAHNDALVRAYRKYGKQLGVRFVDMDLTRTVPWRWASDAANVSHELPTLLPIFAIGDSLDIHTREFAQVVGSDDAQAPVQRVTQMLALTALDVLTDPELLPKARKDLKEWKQSTQSPCMCRNEPEN